MNQFERTLHVVDVLKKIAVFTVAIGFLITVFVLGFSQFKGDCCEGQCATLEELQP